MEAAWDVGMACNVFKLLELLWQHPPDVQACTSMCEALNSLVRCQNVHSNRHNPSRDIAVGFSGAEGVGRVRFDKLGAFSATLNPKDIRPNL
ncbi:hypothetical protein EMCRGX_G026551 [Ephydatia muelleri]